MESYLVIVYTKEPVKKRYYRDDYYVLKELFRQVVFSKEQLEVIQNNFDDVRYINLGEDNEDD